MAPVPTAPRYPGNKKNNANRKFPTNILPVVPIQQWNNIYSGCAPVTGRVHSDQTGWLIAPSIQLMNYILKVYNEDFNDIFAESMRNRSGSEHQ